MSTPNEHLLIHTLPTPLAQVWTKTSTMSDYRSKWRGLVELQTVFYRYANALMLSEYIYRHEKNRHIEEILMSFDRPSMGHHHELFVHLCKYFANHPNENLFFKPIGHWYQSNKSSTIPLLLDLIRTRNDEQHESFLSPHEIVEIYQDYKENLFRTLLSATWLTEFRIFSVSSAYSDGTSYHGEVLFHVGSNTILPEDGTWTPTLQSKLVYVCSTDGRMFLNTSPFIHRSHQSSNLCLWSNTKQRRFIQCVDIIDGTKSEHLPDQITYWNQWLDLDHPSPYIINDDVQNFEIQRALPENTLYLERYNLLERIGDGSMGQVFKAEDSYIPGEVIALKISHDSLHNSPHEERAKREAQILRRLRHPHIVTIYDIHFTQSNVVLAMEYYKSDLSKKQHNLSKEQIYQWADELLQTVEYIHQKGVIHRDIKPHNIFVDDNNQIFLGDFGISKERSGRDITELDNSLIGTTRYLAPEIRSGQTLHTQESDLYALAVTLHELYTGEWSQTPGIDVDDDFGVFLRTLGHPQPSKRHTAKWTYATYSQVAISDIEQDSSSEQHQILAPYLSHPLLKERFWILWFFFLISISIKLIFSLAIQYESEDMTKLFFQLQSYSEKQTVLDRINLIHWIKSIVDSIASINIGLMIPVVAFHIYNSWINNRTTPISSKEQTSREPKEHWRLVGNSRIHISKWGCSGVLFLLFIRAGTLMLLPNEPIESLSKTMYSSQGTIVGLRGEILDRFAQPLVQSESGYNLGLILRPDKDSKDSNDSENKWYKLRPKDFRDLRTELGEHLVEKLPDDVFYPDSEYGYHSVRENGLIKKLFITESQKNILSKKEYSNGILFEPTQRRVYPNDSINSTVLGITQREQSSPNFEGIGGIEEGLNNILQGDVENIEKQRYANLNNITHLVPTVPLKAKSGNNIYTTLDLGMNRYLEEQIQQLKEQNPSLKIGILVLSAQSEIFAAVDSSSLKISETEYWSAEQSESLTLEYYFSAPKSWWIIWYYLAIFNHDESKDILMNKDIWDTKPLIKNEYIENWWKWYAHSSHHFLHLGHRPVPKEPEYGSWVDSGPQTTLLQWVWAQQNIFHTNPARLHLVKEDNCTKTICCHLDFDQEVLPPFFSYNYSERLSSTALRASGADFYQTFDTEDNGTVGYVKIPNHEIDMIAILSNIEDHATLQELLKSLKTHLTSNYSSINSNVMKETSTEENF